jgi:hypothetical protein
MRIVGLNKELEDQEISAIFRPTAGMIYFRQHRSDGAPPMKM